MPNFSSQTESKAVVPLAAVGATDPKISTLKVNVAKEHRRFILQRNIRLR